MNRSNTAVSRRRFLASSVPAAALAGAVATAATASPIGHPAGAARLDLAVSRLAAALGCEAEAARRYSRTPGDGERQRIEYERAIDALQSARDEVFLAARAITSAPLPIALATASGVVAITLRDESSTPAEVDAEDPYEWRVQLLPLVAVAAAR